MSWIYYLLEANLYLALFYAAYYLLLRHDTYYQLNRGYLLGSSLLAFVIPLLQLGFLKPIPVITEQITSVHYPAYGLVNNLVNNVITEPAVTVDHYLIAYISVTLLMAISFVIRIFHLFRLARKGKRMAGEDFRLVDMEDEGRAFSFFSYLFMSKKLTSSDTIIQHELVHIRQKHSLDIVYVELLKIICWFNPVVYLLQNRIRELHEYIADNEVAINQQNVNEYTDFLVSNAYGLPEPLLANSFFNKNLLKNRIMMLHQKRSGALARLKLLIALPLLAGMLCLSTLGFTKDYHVIDLLPRHIAISQPNISVLPPPPPAKFNLTKKGYTYGEVPYAIKGKKYFYVRIMGPDSIANNYGNNTITAAQVKVLKEKYGYNFSTQAAINKMHAVAELATQSTNQATVVPEKGIQGEGHYMPPPPPVRTPVKITFLPFVRYLREHTAYTKDALDNKVNASVVASFDLDDAGKISNIKIEQSAGHGLDEAIVNSMQTFARQLKDKAGNYKIGIDFMCVEKSSMPRVNRKISLEHNFIAEFIIPDKPKVDQVRFPPPVLKPAAQIAAPPKPKVDQVRFPPPVLKSNAQFPTSPKPKVDQVRFPAPVVRSNDTSKSSFDNFYSTISKTVRYPVDARDNNIQGRVSVRFNVDANYHIIDPQILRGVYDSQNGEVIRALKACKATVAMKPGINYIVPVMFALMEQSTGKDLKSEPYINPNPTPAAKTTGFPSVSLNEIVVIGYK